MFVIVPTTPLDASTIRFIAESTNAMLEARTAEQSARGERGTGVRRHTPIGARRTALPVN
ncbi:MAG: hypothetical protein E7Z94_10790 [Actinomyces ruminicola]|uniref:Uncharacterized protein n=1 Tax=Actinomyces ruminicola TaxID=332524 RepID=A0A1G9V5C4_9ACTO|nr:hypothetical protein [Actinomyces ruminicola]MBE6482834.1 hypothetical protein [Actinomyces ruminicola]SDM67065.1 hypothetical protein SAMN04487766_10597 [Actinomyces ruminicola]